MEKRYDEKLTSRIEELAFKGWVEIAWWEAYLWYGQDRLGKNFYRDLRRRYDELKTEEESELYIYHRPEGFLLIESDSLRKISDEKLAGPPLAKSEDADF